MDRTSKQKTFQESVKEHSEEYNELLIDKQGGSRISNIAKFREFGGKINE